MLIAAARSRAQQMCRAAILTLPVIFGAPFAQAADPGEVAYQENCQGCHEGQVEKAPHKSMLELMTPGGIVAALETGVMRPQGAALDGKTKRLIAGYITGTPADADLDSTAALKFCDARKGWFARDDEPMPGGWGFDPGNKRQQTFAQAGLKPEDFAKLEVKWAFAFPGAVRVRSQPTPAGGALFVGGHDGYVYALDEKTGCVRWRFKASAEVRTSIVIPPWNTKDKAAVPLIYFGDLIGNVYAVKAEDGTLVWRDRPSDHPSATITAAPTWFENRLYVAVSSLEVTAAASPDYACCTFRGQIASYDALTGKRGWTASTIEEPSKETGKNSAGTPRIGPSGAPIWSGLALDPKARRIYAGTGENYSSPATNTSDAILAYDLDTGKMLWHYQATGQDVWNMGCEVENKTNCPPEKGPDFDFGAAMVFARDGQGRDLVIAGQKSGVVYALDPSSGKLVWRQRVGRGGIQGGVHFGMAVDDDRLYVPISDFPDGHTYPDPGTPGMHALDLSTGKALWQNIDPDRCKDRKFCAPGISAAATALPGFVAAGGMDGWLRIYDGKTGAIVWSIDTARDFKTVSGIKGFGGSMGGAAGPVFHRGMMYVSSGYGIYYHMPGNVLLAFGVKK